MSRKVHRICGYVRHVWIDHALSSQATEPCLEQNLVMINIQASPAQTQARQNVQARQNAIEVFESLLRDRRLYPDRAAEIDAYIQQRFGQTQAVWILDSAGFSHQTEQQGIIPALLDIYQMRDIAIPLIEGNAGTLIKAEADNLYATFPNPNQAVNASWAVLEQLNAVGLAVSIGIGYGDVLVIDQQDVFGHEMNLASKLGEDIADHNQVLLTAAAFSQLSSQTVEADSFTIEISGLMLDTYRIQRLISEAW